MSRQAQTLERPDLDISDAREFLHGHPHAKYDALRQADPVHYVENPMGGEPYWLLTRHETVRSVSLESKT